jgi:hypothetical protein
VRRFVLVSIGISLVSVFISSPNTAIAKTNCREIARDTQVEIVASANSKQLKTSEDLIQNYNEVFMAFRIAYPECESEFKILWDWNRKGAVETPFPFLKSEDPKSFVLGPVGWWWDTIYNRLLGRSTLLMIFFGWELFLMPFPLIIGVVGWVLTVPFALAKAFLESRRRNK